MFHLLTCASSASPILKKERKLKYVGIRLYCNLAFRQITHLSGWSVNRLLSGGSGVNCGHQAFNNTEFIIKHFCYWC